MAGRRAPIRKPMQHAVASEKALALSIAKKKAKQPAEDSPNWKWWKHGNQSAGAAYAAANPPPKGYKVSEPQGGVVTAKKRNK